MPNLVGINHIALEVGDLDNALAFWESIFGPLVLPSRLGSFVFIDMGDQFIALTQGRTQPPDQARHFGLVVDDKDAVRARLEELGIRIFGRLGLDFYDPWGNLIQVVDYRDVQFTKADSVLRASFRPRSPPRPPVASPLVVFERVEVSSVAGSLLLDRAGGTATAGA